MNKQTDISSLGEFGLIKRIQEIVNIHTGDPALHNNLIKGVSDDTAVYRTSPGTVQLFTTDAFVEGVHFDLTYTSLKHLGWKSLVASISDIAAMGGIPRYAACVLSLPKKISAEMIDELYAGIVLACKQYKCMMVGGDTTGSLANMTVSIALTGEAEEQKILYRNGAKAGDYLCVSGHLGASLAGLKILQREKHRYEKSGNGTTFTPNIEPYTLALEKHLMPKPRLDISAILTKDVTAHAMIDISDGLASEVHHLCNASDTGAEIYEHNLPLEAVTQNIAAELGESATDYALHGGEEYELLFAISEEEHAKLEPVTNDVTIIGRVTNKEKGIELVREQGEREALPFGGWDHFSK